MVSNYVYFCFFGDNLDPEKISTSLNLTPTRILIKGDPVPVLSSWDYRVIAKLSFDLEEPLHQLIDTFESKIDLINDLKIFFELNSKIQFVFDIDIKPESSTPFFSLNKRVISFLAKTNSEVGFDLYKSY